MSKTVAMLGPISPAQLRDLLDTGSSSGELTEGLGGPPVNLLVRELVSRGRHMLVVSLDPAVEHELVLQGPSLRIIIGPYRARPARDFFAAERAYVQEVLRRERPDMVHAQWTYEWALAAQASGLPHIITAHDAPLNILRFDFGPYRIAKTLMAYRVLSRARRVVSVSPYVSAHLSRLMLYRGRANVIPNGMPESLFARASLSRPAGRPVTFATSLNGWAGRKNGKVAIEAFARTRLRHPEARLIMFGRGHGWGEEGQHWAGEHGVVEAIEFAGHVPYATMIERLADEVDVLVHPALEEAQGMVLLEAMALGVPVIAGEGSGGVPWTLDEGRAGVLVNVTDAHAVADAMDGLANDLDERISWGQRGRELAIRRFHIRRVADAYEQIYTELGA